MVEGLMPSTIYRGMTYLIPKDGKDLTTLNNWRSLTILTNAYKIMAKVRSKRLKSVLGDIIHTTQTGFLENWSIVDNVITFWEYSAWAEEQGVDLAVMLLDFEKAYDKIS